MSAVKHDDGIHRCHWCGTDPLYVHYHDTDWGVPEYDSRALFEKLILDGFQAGLSWITILRKRENFRKAFDGFKPEVIVNYQPAKLEALMQDAGIVRNRAKIEGTVKSAEAYLKMEDFSAYLWDHVGGKPVVLKPGQAIPTKNDVSEKISKDLVKRGFKFVGPTIVYAFMEACGFYNDHHPDCHRHKAVQKLVRK
ncbi:DNA-3-methyladenine glycosylase I [Aestuariivirga litoralis]|uniref:DNA-3-methyladenine glycosylase I n=1 Tax=Aestuariivirga litoralis TaxID=2650924 RepID=UPI0018C5291C|nr:DNA-3-methyladenine glycosylase I [Aestuariivirga litoralis]MBG1230831.1 DNA-3-methyladenine glycosylase I [Aestuariivirga litoralis]